MRDGAGMTCLLTLCTPPCKPVSNRPFPRPPARTWALMTDPLAAKRLIRSGESPRGYEERHGLNCLAASKASSGDFAAMLFGVGMPYYTKRWVSKS